MAGKVGRRGSQLSDGVGRREEGTAMNQLKQVVAAGERGKVVEWRERDNDYVEQLY